MIEIKKYKDNKRFQHHYDVIRANAPVSYGGLKLYEGKRNYLMQSPREFAATLCYLEDHFKDKGVQYLEIGTASNLTNSMIWNSLNIKENVILDNLECPYTAESLVGNLSFKQNTVLIVGDSTQESIKEKVEFLGYKYNLMLIDGNHDIDNDAVPGVRKFVTTNLILNTKFKQCANFIDSSNYLNKNTFGSQCGIGIYKKI